MKYYQFGVESIGGSVTTTWDAKDYGLTYNGATSYNGVVTNSTLGGGNNRGGSYITYDSSGGAYCVGCASYTVANAHSSSIDGTLSAGQVQWYESSTGLGALVRLW